MLALARAGLLQVVDEPINKDTEMHPLVRWQFRGGIAEGERKAFLFTQPTDSKGRRYDIAVLVAGLAANREVYRIGFGKPLDEIGRAWIAAMAAPIEPRVVADAPCQDIAILGDALDRPGQALDGLPVPISTPGWDNAPYLSAGHYITRDPDTGRQNVGNYRGQLKAPRRLGMNPSVELRAGIYAHWLKYKERGEPMPCCVVVGCPPVVSYAAVQKMPEHLDEVWVAGAIAGGPINVVRAKTVDLLVPAEAEIVIEGLIDTEMLEPEAPFGESHGYVNLQEYNAFMEVTAITRRRHPILTSFISQVTPSESSVIRRVAMEPVYLHHLAVGAGGARRETRRDARAAHQPLCGDRDPVRARHAGDRGLARALRGLDAAPLRRQVDRRDRRGHRSGQRRRAVLGDVVPLPAAARSARSCRTRIRATARAARATAARPPPCWSTRCSRARLRRSRCPGASSWNAPRRSGSGSGCRRSSRSRRGTATTSATGRPSSSARPRWRRRATTSRSARSSRDSGAATSP